MIRFKKVTCAILLVFLAFCCICISCLGVTYIYRQPIDNFIKYYYNANLSEGQLQCYQYPELDEINAIVNKNTGEYLQISNYIEEAQGNVKISIIGVDYMKPRCQGKYQFLIEYLTYSELMDIKSILTDQMIDSVPVIIVSSY